MKPFRLFLGEGKESSHTTFPLPDKSGDGEAVYMLADAEEGDLDCHVSRRSDGSYYATADSFDFDAPNAEAMRAKLKQYGARYAGWEND